MFPLGPLRISNPDRLPLSIHKRLRAKKLDGFTSSSFNRGLVCSGSRGTSSTYSTQELPGNLFALARRVGNAY
jgi:hypothetical protein